MNCKALKHLALTILVSAVFFGAASAQEVPQPCPTILVLGPSGVTWPGDQMTFTVTVAGPTEKELEYTWSVSRGIITQGQGTAAITVQSSIVDADAIIVASVFVTGIPPGCTDTASESGPISSALPTDCTLDQFGHLEPDDTRARFDSFFIELMNNPSNLGVIILYLADDEKIDKSNPRVALILGHIRFREFDINRITLQFERIDYVNTKLTRIPPGGRMPTCNDCTIVKASDLL